MFIQLLDLSQEGLNYWRTESKDMDAARPMYDGGWKRTWGDAGRGVRVGDGQSNREARAKTGLRRLRKVEGNNAIIPIVQSCNGRWRSEGEVCACLSVSVCVDQLGVDCQGRTATGAGLPRCEGEWRDQD